MVKCRLALPVGLSEALVGIYEVRLQLQSLLECLYSFLRRKGKSLKSASPFKQTIYVRRGIGTRPHVSTMQRASQWGEMDRHTDRKIDDARLAIASKRIHQITQVMKIHKPQPVGVDYGANLLHVFKKVQGLPLFSISRTNSTKIQPHTVIKILSSTQSTVSLSLCTFIIYIAQTISNSGTKTFPISFSFTTWAMKHRMYNIDLQSYGRSRFYNTKVPALTLSAHHRPSDQSTNE